MRAVLADTGPLYALAVSTDGLHGRAHEEARRLTREGIGVVGSYTTLFETHSLLLRRTTPTAAQRWQRQLASGSSLITPKAEDFEAVLRQVQRYSDQALSLFDGMVAVLSEQLGIPVWTFDADFDVMRADVWR